MPTEIELRTRYKEEADSILVARAIERGDNGKANPTAFEGEGWATLTVPDGHPKSPTRGHLKLLHLN